jgi:hypothetical protein
MEQLKGMSDAEARRWLQKHGYGVGDIEMIMAGEDPNAAPEPIEEPVPVAVKAAPEPKKEAPKAVEVKAAPAPVAKAAPAPKPVAKPAPKASK